jgi:hypothetical protein
VFGGTSERAAMEAASEEAAKSNNTALGYSAQRRPHWRLLPKKRRRQPSWATVQRFAKAAMKAASEEATKHTGVACKFFRKDWNCLLPDSHLEL